MIAYVIKYNILDTPSLGTYNLSTSAYCYEIDGKGNFVMPEFIVGYYDVNTKTFNKNPKYYELLTEDEKKRLFEKVKLNYVKTIEDACGLDYYKEVITNLPGWDFPLTENEVTSLMQKDNGHQTHI